MISKSKLITFLEGCIKEEMSIQPNGWQGAISAYYYILQYVDGLITVEHSDHSGIAETTKGEHKMAKAAKKAKAKKAKK